jgi:hypothetical protein
MVMVVDSTPGLTLWGAFGLAGGSAQRLREASGSSLVGLGSRPLTPGRGGLLWGEAPGVRADGVGAVVRFIVLLFLLLHLDDAIAGVAYVKSIHS